MNQHRKLLGIIALGGVLTLGISGCAAGGGPGDDGGDAIAVSAADYNPQPRENLQEGGEVVFPITEITPQMNPLNGDASADTSRLATWYTPQILLMEEDGTAYKNDAYLDEWDFGVADGKTFVNFTINDDAVWNDGSPIDWKAFEATWIANRSYEEGYSPNATDGYKEIESVTKGETDKQAVVTFKAEFAWPQMLFTTVLNPNVNTPEIFNEGFIDEPHAEWGAGPYKLSNFDINGGTVVFEPNENWWGEKPLLDKVTFRQLDRAASINAFKNGEIDMASTNTKDRLEQVKDMDSVVTYRAQQTANTLLQVDADKPQFQDINVRKAFFMAIDVEQQKKVVWNGLNYEEDPAGSFTLYSFQPGYVNALEEAGYKFDLEGAKGLLDEAGWVEGEDGIREKDGVALAVTYPIFSDDPVQEASAKALQQQLKAAGFDVTIDTRSPQDFSTDYSTKNWDIFSLRFTASDPFGAAWFCQIYCSDSGLNLSGTGTPEIDTKIQDQLETIADPEAQTAEAMKLEAEIFAETWGIFPMYNGPEIWTVKEGLANLTPEPYVGLDLFGVQPVENTGWEK
ncbi:peptide/nickel transport system substrate-binding protein [Rhodoglobus vestalii]|uniref:Peptide/nickel transport system substrate-binding protein n=1 Tax=Rhodoglobus vestalii TaxID=193384 RepID=A0A8H2K6V1_9MICO|nr:ABC transporter family substrate-binding protein [Rhodoglobus vestalii]TQO19893.1 peptide/nickel transport system substrate-binding protein [Rhodoglobus vestalii]